MFTAFISHPSIHQDSSLASTEVERDGDLCISKDLPETRRQNCGCFVSGFFFQREKVMGKGKLALIKVVGTMDIFSKKHEGAERHEKVLGK